MSDTTPHDLFSVSDVDTNDFQCFNTSTNVINHSQPISNLSVSCSTTHSNAQTIQSGVNGESSSNTLKLIIEKRYIVPV